MSTQHADTAERTSAHGGWALGGFMFGAASSLGLNLEAAWLGITKAIGHAPYGKQAAAVMWPLLLIFSVEVMSRTAWPETDGWKTWGWLAVRFGGFGTIGVTSAVISYGHVHTVLIYWGYTEAQARSGAFCLDALMVLCGFARLATSHATEPAVSDPPVSETAPIEQEGSPTSTPPAPLTREGLDVGSSPLALTATSRPEVADTGQGLSVPLSAPPARPETTPGRPDMVSGASPAGTPGSADRMQSTGDADASEGASGLTPIVHLVPALDRISDAPGTASRTAPGGASQRGASAARTASRPARVTASTDAPGTASDLPAPALLDAVRVHLIQHAGAYPSARRLAREMHVHQTKAQAAITHVRTERESRQAAP